MSEHITGVDLSAVRNISDKKSEYDLSDDLTAEDLKLLYCQVKKDEAILRQKINKLEKEKLKLQDELKLKQWDILLVKKAWKSASTYVTTTCDMLGDTGRIGSVELKTEHRISSSSEVSARSELSAF